MKVLSLGVIGTSNKETEDRVPIYPPHLLAVKEEYRKKIYFEKGYGERFNISDEVLQERYKIGGFMSREELHKKCDIILLPKPTPKDFEFWPEKMILWGWPHFVQQEAITQEAIDKKISSVTFEGMFDWKKGVSVLHTFHKNNEMAGYCGVIHCLVENGMTGAYGARGLKACVISLGSVGRGCVNALIGLGFTDITVYTQRPVSSIACPYPSLKYKQYKPSDRSAKRTEVVIRPDDHPFIDDLKEYDIICNAILQDTDHVVDYMKEGEEEVLKEGTIIVDVSCDEGIGFPFAKPTTFSEPGFRVGKRNHVYYYSVDHSPTYMWKSASIEISEALTPYIEIVMGGPEEWKKDETVWRATEALDGEIRNPKVFSFQNRSPEFPHKKLS